MYRCVTFSKLTVVVGLSQVVPGDDQQVQWFVHSAWHYSQRYFVSHSIWADCRWLFLVITSTKAAVGFASRWVSVYPNLAFVLITFSAVTSYPRWRCSKTWSRHMARLLNREKKPWWIWAMTISKTGGTLQYRSFACTSHTAYTDRAFTD